MGEEDPRPKNVKESEEENVEPAAPVQLALTGGGHTAEGRDTQKAPRTNDRPTVVRMRIKSDIEHRGF
jgi:hypothetical protein